MKITVNMNIERSPAPAAPEHFLRDIYRMLVLLTVLVPSSAVVSYVTSHHTSITTQIVVGLICVAACALPLAAAPGN